MKINLIFLKIEKKSSERVSHARFPTSYLSHKNILETLNFVTYLGHCRDISSVYKQYLLYDTGTTSPLSQVKLDLFSCINGDLLLLFYLFIWVFIILNAMDSFILHSNTFIKSKFTYLFFICLFNIYLFMYLL